jgi:AraC-like DNA-binding protein
MITRFRLSRHIVTGLEERSVSVASVLRQAGLPADLLRAEKILLSTEQLFAFWSAVAEVSGDPAIGLELGSEVRIERQEVATLAALSAASFRDALDRAARYKQLTCPEQIQIVVRRGECAIRFCWTLAKGPESWVLTDLCFAWLTALASRGTGGVVRPTRIEFSRGPRKRQLYERHFGCPVRFGAASSALIFRASDLDRPFVTHNADLLGMLAPQLDVELANRDNSADARDQVKTVLRRLLAGRRPEIRDVARELASSPRTLQRRLGDLGVSYQGVLEEARRDMASDYLLHSSLELSEIAYLLGYEDANSFFRAFTRWEGLSPGRWRLDRRARSSWRPVAVTATGRGPTERRPYGRSVPSSQTPRLR